MDAGSSNGIKPKGQHRAVTYADTALHGLLIS